MTFCDTLPKIVFIISTHTLTWSVTPLIKTYFAYYINFNSHAHVERDLVP